MIEYKSMKDVNGNVYCVKIQKPFVQQTNKKHYNIQNVNKDCLLSYCHSYRHWKNIRTVKNDYLNSFKQNKEQFFEQSKYAVQNSYNTFTIAGGKQKVIKGKK